MNIEGFSFDVTASFDTTNTQANSKTNTVTGQDKVNATLPPGSAVDVDIVTTIHTNLMIYKVVFAIGSDNPEGSIAKATKTQGDWDKFFRIEDIAGDRVKVSTQLTYGVVYSNFYLYSPWPDTKETQRRRRRPAPFQVLAQRLLRSIFPQFSNFTWGHEEVYPHRQITTLYK
jgi:hypothetical protein